MIFAVTGSNGFIGRHLCAALDSAGHDVRAVVRADFASKRFDDLLQGADVVIHAAAATRAPSHIQLRRSNVDLTRRVLESARAARVARFVFISSQAAAGPAAAYDRPISEDDVPSPIEEYGRTKRDAEELVRHSGLDFTVVRPAAVYGRDDRDFALLFALARRRIAIHPANREQWISIVHVDDCVNGIISAARSERAIGRTYFLANDAPVQWRTIYELAIAPQRLRIDLQFPRAAVTLGALVGDAIARLTNRALLLSTDKAALARPRYWICAPDRAKRELGFVQRIALNSGIAAAAAVQRSTYRPR
jgi:nucleoside-diphosphate-sugar epimerase